MRIAIHGEVEYNRENGDSVHSDMCPEDCDFNKMSDKFKSFLHGALDEWLTKSRGTGIFYIGSEEKVDIYRSNDE